MAATRLRRYRHFPTVPDALALVKLLRLTAIAFETRYERGANYDRARHEPDRLAVWIRAADYAYVQRLEAALTREQALALAADALPADQLQRIVALAAPRPSAIEAFTSGELTRQLDLPATLTGTRRNLAAFSLFKELRHRLLGVLFLAGLTALIFYWLE